MNTLQPIATAPRDGTYIMVFYPSDNRLIPTEATTARWEGDMWLTPGGYLFDDATHWMPLPSQPTPATETPGAFKPGDPVSKVGGDYSFDGTVVAVFPKLPREGKPQAVRYVVEDDRGVLHVYSAKNLQIRH